MGKYLIFCYGGTFMKKLSRLAALAAAAATTCLFGACGSSTANALTINGMQVKAGIYIYYSYTAYNEAIDTISTQNSELDTSDDKLVKKQTINGKSTLNWIQDRAQKYCQEYVSVLQKCEELGVTLTDDQVTTVDTQLAQVWEQRGETFRDNGISEDSIRCILEYTYYATDLFLYYYDVDAAEGVKDSEVQDFYAENNARVRYITFNLKDGNGEALTDSKDIQNMKDMVNGYCDDVKKCTSEEDKLAKFNDIQSEYNAYVTSLSEEAAGATTSSDAASGTTTTTTAGETDAAEETEAAAQTTVAAENAPASEDAAVTTTAAAAEGETTTTTAAESTDTTETTTTTNIHANEQIIAKVTTAPAKDDDGIVTTTTEPTYQPSKAAYDAIFAEDVTYDAPFVVEDDTAYYLIMRMDIRDRMTADDLWTEDRVQSVISQMYSDAYMDKMDEWTAAQTVEVNKRAVKRYDPFDIELSFDSQS